MNRKFLYLAILSTVLISSCSKSCQKPAAGQEQRSDDHKDEEHKDDDHKDDEGANKAADQAVFFEAPTNGQELSSPVEVVMGVKGMMVKPAGGDINDKNSGHHHILIDNPHGFIEEGQVIPADERNIHFGQGQTSASIKLAPGIHTLTLQFADGAHRSYGKRMAAQITVTVVPGSEAP